MYMCQAATSPRNWIQSHLCSAMAALPMQLLLLQREPAWSQGTSSYLKLYDMSSGQYCIVGVALCHFSPLSCT